MAGRAVIARGLILLVAGLAGGCAHAAVQPWQYAPRSLADTLPIWEPQERDAPIIYDAARESFFRPIGNAFNVKRHVAGVPPAWNVDPFDDVVASTWFTHRNTVTSLTPETVERGPSTGTGPDQSGAVIVKSIKTVGITPGFNIKDASGQRWIIKFDPPGHLELASGAEVVTTNLFWAAGYNTPENHVVQLDPDALILDDDLEADFVEGDSVVHYEVETGDPRHELTLEVFHRHVLDRYPRRPDGSVRAMASKFLDGVPKGPFPYQDTRTDDPNDVIPHEHRRELRGLYVLAAWLNHIDAREGNTFDMFIPDPHSPAEAPRFGYLRHHLIDFGATLGSASVFPHNPRHGTENDLDLDAIGKRFLTLGMYERPWEDLDDPPVAPAAGYYSVENFDPADWRPNFPNPAFDNRTPRDGYWGAKIVMSFTDQQLEAAVRAGRYSDPAAATYILKGLRERRDATGRYWFRQVSPLDRPRIEGGVVAFDDLWVRHFGGRESYRWEFEWKAAENETRGAVTGPRIPLPSPGGAPAARDTEEANARLRVWKVFDDGEEAPRPAEFWLAWDSAARSWSLVGARY